MPSTVISSVWKLTFWKLIFFQALLPSWNLLSLVKGTTVLKAFSSLESFVIWVISSFIYCSVGKQGIWSKTTILVTYFSVIENLFTHWHGCTRVLGLVFVWLFKYFLFSFQNFGGGYNFCAPKGAVLWYFLGFLVPFFHFQLPMSTFPDKSIAY